MLKKTVFGAFAVLIFTSGLLRADSFDPATGAITDDRWPAGMPLGGIGDGKIELLTDGSFGNFTNQHNWDNSYGWAKGAFAAIRVQVSGGEPMAKVLRLQGKDEYSGLSGMAHTRMVGLFPRAHIDFTDTSLPVGVQLEAFSALVPHDPKDSCLPIAALDYKVTNTGTGSANVSLLLAWPNLIGWDGLPSGTLAGDTQSDAKIGTLQGLHYTTSQNYHDKRQLPIGDYFLAARTQGVQVTTCPMWDESAATPAFWPDFLSTGALKAVPDTHGAHPAGAVAASADLLPGQSMTFRFYIACAMPHLITGLDLAPPAPPGQDNPPERWTTNTPLAPGQELTVDMIKTVTANGLTMDMGKYPGDYPRGLRVETSRDAKTWTQVASLSAEEMKSAAAGGKISIPLSPSTGRYLRLTNLGSVPGTWWSIHKLEVRAAGHATPLLFTPTYVFGPGRPEDGHYWQNWFSNSMDMTAYFDSNADALYQATLDWQQPVLDSTLPFWLKFKMINGASTMFANTILTKDGRFTVLESPRDMGGALGTMDQRIAAHAFYTAFFPDLDRAELELFAHCQLPNGEIPHFVGNIHFVIGDPNVDYGITGWPDLTTGWVAQIVKYERLTGNKGFLDRMLPHVSQAMQWLENSGKDNHGIPKGGSSFDYGQKSSGEFIYTASLYLAALRGAATISPPADASRYQEQFKRVQSAVMTDLWNGTFFRTFKSPSGNAIDENSFVNSLAGDWLTRVSGLPRTLAPGIIHQEIAQIIDRHQLPSSPVSPSEVTPDGKVVQETSYVLQLEPYVGCEAIYENYVDAGLETLHRDDVLQWETPSHLGWSMKLSFSHADSRTSLQYYVTNPTTWFVLNALTGAALDLPKNVLYLSPRLATTETEAHLPIYFPRFWGWVDYVPARHLLSLRIDKTFDANEKHVPPFYRVDGQTGDVLPQQLVIKSVAADGDAPLITLPAPFLVQKGAVLDLSAYMNQLAPHPKSEVVPPLTKS